MRRRPVSCPPPALIGAVLGAAAPPALAEPAAEVNPRSVEPGGTLTFSRLLRPDRRTPRPRPIDASSQAFEQGTVALQRIPGNDDSAAAPPTRRSARIAPAADFEAGAGAVNSATEWGVDGGLPGGPGRRGQAVERGLRRRPRRRRPARTPHISRRTQPDEGPDACNRPASPPTTPPTPPLPVPAGVHAGARRCLHRASVPAMVAGGLLIAEHSARPSTDCAAGTGGRHDGPDVGRPNPRSAEPRIGQSRGGRKSRGRTADGRSRGRPEPRRARSRGGAGVANAPYTWPL